MLFRISRFNPHTETWDPVTYRRSRIYGSLRIAKAVKTLWSRSPYGQYRIEYTDVDWKPVE